MSFQSRHPFADQPDLFVTPAGQVRPSLLQRLAFTWALWRQRIEARRCLAHIDARTLRDCGISSAAAAYESGQPFWRKMGSLR
ncbi:MAG TPA: hypothetical protein VMI56_26950 [Reyranella sp.]|nr:hypothetical protein [Reyranella sp.]